MISFLKGKTSFKKSEIVDICKKELSKEIPATVYGKIASEFAVSQGSKWILKTSAI